MTNEQLKQEWFRSGAYVRQPFKKWEAERAEKLAEKWFKRYQVAAVQRTAS